MTLDSFLDRLGLEEGDAARLCVRIAFVPEEGNTLPEGRATECLGWVVEVQKRRMATETFHALLQTFLTELGDPPTTGDLETIAKCMLSGYQESEADLEEAGG